MSNINTEGKINARNLTTPLGVADPGSAVEIDLSNGDFNTLTVQTVGTYTGALSLQVTLDGKTWVTITAAVFQNIVTNALSATIASGVQGVFQVNIAGMQKVRITALAATTGEVTVSLNASSALSNVNLGAAIPTSTVTATMTSTTEAAPAATIAGATMTKINSAATNNATVLKASQGRLLGVVLANNHATNWAYFKLYNLATAPNPASSTVIGIIGVPPNSERTVVPKIPVTFATGIGFAIVGGAGDTDNTAVLANQVVGFTLHV